MLRKSLFAFLTLFLCLSLTLPALSESGGPAKANSGVQIQAHGSSALEWLRDLLFGKRQKTSENMTHQETVAALRNLGIEIPDETVRETEEALAAMILDLKRSGFNRGEQYYDFVLLLLCRLGEGEYDFDTGIWTPTSSQVYAFDAEVWDIEHMYTLFLQGVSSIVPGFECSDVTERITEWSQEEAAHIGSTSAEGKTDVAFTLNGRHYERKLSFMGDWFSEEAITWVNEVLAQGGFPGKLHMFFDGGQGLILFYGDDAYGEELRKVVPGCLRNFFSIETQRRRRKTDENKIHVVSARGGHDGIFVHSGCRRRTGRPCVSNPGNQNRGNQRQLCQFPRAGLRRSRDRGKSVRLHPATCGY